MPNDLTRNNVTMYETWTDLLLCPFKNWLNIRDILAETTNCDCIAGAHDSGCRKYQLRVVGVKQAKAKKSHSWANEK